MNNLGSSIRDPDVLVITKEEGVYPPESYEELRSFIKEISKSDQAKVVFVSAT